VRVRVRALVRVRVRVRARARAHARVRVHACVHVHVRVRMRMHVRMRVHTVQCAVCSVHALLCVTRVFLILSESVRVCGCVLKSCLLITLAKTIDFSKYIYEYLYIHVHIHIYTHSYTLYVYWYVAAIVSVTYYTSTCGCTHPSVPIRTFIRYGVALVNRIDKITGLFCKRAP